MGDYHDKENVPRDDYVYATCLSLDHWFPGKDSYVGLGGRIVYHPTFAACT